MYRLNPPLIGPENKTNIDLYCKAVILKYACSSNQVNIYTPATIWFTFI